MDRLEILKKVKAEKKSPPPIPKPKRKKSKETRYPFDLGTDNTMPTDSDTKYTDTKNSQPKDSHPKNTETIDSQAKDSHPTNRDTINTHAINSEPIYRETKKSKTNFTDTKTSLTKNTDTKISPTENRETTNRVTIDSQTINSDTIETPSNNTQTKNREPSISETKLNPTNKSDTIDRPTNLVCTKLDTVTQESYLAISFYRWLNNADYTPSEKKILGTLFEATSNAEKEAAYSHGDLAKDLKMGLNTVRRSIDRLNETKIMRSVLKKHESMIGKRGGHKCLVHKIEKATLNKYLEKQLN